MKFYVDELPKSCCGCDCPFNYNKIGCKAIMFSIGDDENYIAFIQSVDGCILKIYLNQNEDNAPKRYPDCPLRLYKENSNE